MYQGRDLWTTTPPTAFPGLQYPIPHFLYRKTPHHTPWTTMLTVALPGPHTPYRTPWTLYPLPRSLDHDTPTPPHSLDHNTPTELPGPHTPHPPPHSLDPTPPTALRGPRTRTSSVSPRYTPATTSSVPCERVDNTPSTVLGSGLWTRPCKITTSPPSLGVPCVPDPDPTPRPRPVPWDPKQLESTDLRRPRSTVTTPSPSPPLPLHPVTDTTPPVSCQRNKKGQT